MVAVDRLWAVTDELQEVEMLMTEKDAAGKWCPFAFVLGTLIGRSSAAEPDRTIAMGGQNRGYQMGGALHNCHCISKDCMMWRKHGQIGIGPSGEKRDRDMDGRTRWENQGYCGLASKPAGVP